MAGQRKESIQTVFCFYCGYIYEECNWEEYNKDFDELILIIKDHMLKRHGVKEISPKFLRRIQSAIDEIEEEEHYEDEYQDEERDEEENYNNVNFGGQYEDYDEL